MIRLPTVAVVSLAAATSFDHSSSDFVPLVAFPDQQEKSKQNQANNDIIEKALHSAVHTPYTAKQDTEHFYCSNLNGELSSLKEEKKRLELVIKKMKVELADLVDQKSELRKEDKEEELMPVTCNPELNGDGEEFILNPKASIMEYLRPSLFGDLDEISRNLKEGKLVVIKDAFNPDFAEYMWKELSREDLEWDLLQDVFDDGFHYHHHNIQEHSHKFSQTMKEVKSIFFNPTSKEFMSDLSGRDCNSKVHGAGSASHYMIDDHSLPHSDYLGKRTVAFVWHLTKDWDPKWGGALYWCNAHNHNPFVHASFNTLNLFSVSPNSTHFVTAVSKQAKGKRLTFNGWYESDWMPSIEEPIEDMSEEDRLSLTYEQLEAITGMDLELLMDPERKVKLATFQQLLHAQLQKKDNPDITFVYKEETGVKVEVAAREGKGFEFNHEASILDYLRPDLFKNPGYLDEIRQNLKDGKLVVIKEAFHPDLAEHVWQELTQGDLEWDLLQDGFDDGFHYHHHNIQEHSQKFSKTMKQVKQMFNHQKSKKFISELSDRDCSSEGDGAGSASHYMVGDHSLPHTDYQEKKAFAYVWHLTKDWDPKWGGAFYWVPAHHHSPFVHASFNSLILHNVTPNSTHFVTVVNKGAIGKRLAFNGWYESDWMPDLQDPIVEMPEEDRLLLTAGQLGAIAGADLELVTDKEHKLKLSAFQDKLNAQLGKTENPDVFFV